MKPVVVSIVAASTVLRLFISFVVIPNATNDGDGIISRALGPGILPAIGAAILDPVHTWDHLEEACFWLENSPFTWTESWIRGGDSVAGYGSIYTHGTRIIAPPLVVAFLGETLICPGSKFLRSIKTLLMFLADAIGAYCIYHLGERIFEMEDVGNEAEMERRTLLSDKNTGGDETLINDLVIPGILRPDRGWIVDLPSKILPPDECLIESSAIGMSSDDKNKPECGPNNDGCSNTNVCSLTSLGREPLLSLNQLPIVASLLYFSNPISMLANATGSLRSLWDSLMLLSFYFATIPPTKISKDGVPMKIPSATMVAVFLCMATYADVSYAAFILPILLWRGLFSCGKADEGTTFQRLQHRDWKKVLVLFIVHLGGLHYFASLLVGGDSSSYRRVLASTILPSIAFVQQDFSGSVPGPSMGLHW
jgi:hypothetical protein